MGYSVINEMGKGKTLFSTLFALDYSNQHPKSKIYANYTLNIQNAIFTPYMFLPFTDIELLAESEIGCCIICDDFYALKCAKNLISVIVNMSRKANIEIILTCQYYRMIDPIIRSLTTITEVDYKKDSDTLYVVFWNNDKSQVKGAFKVSKAVEKIKGIYNTREIVKPQTPTRVNSEILRFSNNLEELEQNINLYYNSKSERKNLLKELTKQLDLK